MLFLFGFFSAALAAEPQEKSYLTPYNALLAAHVHQGEKNGIPCTLIDYQAWSMDKNHAEAMRLLAATDTKTLKAAAADAFWINAYNLLTIDLILKNKEKESIKNIGSILDNPGASFSWQIDGQRVTLDDIIRTHLPSKLDPRLQLALVNGTISAPDLRTHAYSAEGLEVELDEQVTQFVNNEKKGLSIRGTVLEIAKIFQPMTREIEMHYGSMIGFFQKYHPATPYNGMVQGYFDYDWSLNGSWEATAPASH